MTLRSRRAALAVSVLLAASAAAQAPNAPAPRLLNARSLTCRFTALATGTWKSGQPEATITPATLTLGFSAIDTQDGTADAVGSSGKAHITVRAVGNYLTLMQMDPYGAVYLTTVMNTETRDGKLQAVHTRHEYTPVQLPGLTSRPEQYYGECEVR